MTFPALVKRSDEYQQLLPLGPSFLISDRHLEVVQGAVPTLEECTDAAVKLKAVHGALRYWRGDFIRIVESLLGERSAQIIDAEFMDEKEAAAERFVAEHVAPQTRLLAPSWDHARAVANLKPKEQEKWLQQALEADWIASKLKSEIAKEAAGGETMVRFLIVVDAQTEAKQKDLVKRLQAEGYTCTTRESMVKKKKAVKGKGKRAKKGEVTARRRGSPKIYTRRRTH